MRRAALVLVLPLILGGVGYWVGYAQGRTDLEAAARLRAATGAAIDYVTRSATGYDSRKAWYAWSAALDEHKALVAKTNEAIALITHSGPWTEAESAAVGVAAGYAEQAAAALRVAAPPGAAWYRDGLVDLLTRHAALYRRFDAAARSNDVRGFEAADIDEQGLFRELAAL